MSVLRESASLRRNVEKQNVMSFAMANVPKIMSDLKVAHDKWALGGSVAAILYGCNIERCPHDIDVIVPMSIVDFVVSAIRNDFRYIHTPERSSVDEELGMNHFAFRTANGPVIDIIGISDGLFKIHNYGGLFNIMTFEQLLKSKKQYNRQKDIDDLVLMNALYEEMNPEQKQLGNIDALAKLKEKMQGK